MMTRTLILAAAIAAMCMPAAAQQIVAQSNFVDRQALASLPQVSITARADFVLFSVRYVTGTRSEDERKDELARMFQTITQRAARVEGTTIEVGQPGNSAAIETVAMRELIKQDQYNRSTIELVLKVMVRPNDTFEAIRTRTEKFVADAPLNGRVEAVIGDNQFLGVSEPKKHREVLVAAIAEEVRLMRAAFAATDGAVSVSLTGMEQRALTRPVGPLDLEIYVPYRMSLVSGQD